VARELNEIKTSLKNRFMDNETIREQYGLEDGDEFDKVFSSVSLENQLIIENQAMLVLDLEQWADTVEAKLNKLLEEKKAHRLLWYQQITLNFMVDMVLVEGNDYYDTTGMTEADIEEARVIKFCAVDESNDASEITIKIATLNGSTKEPVSAEVFVQVKEYLERVKDGGVKINVINLYPYKLGAAVDVYYDGLLLSGDVEAAVRKAVDNYINNLPFNGEFSNMALVDAIQKVTGVKVVQHRWSNIYNNSGEQITTVSGIYIPLPGYMESSDDITVNMIAHVS